MNTIREHNESISVQRYRKCSVLLAQRSPSKFNGNLPGKGLNQFCGSESCVFRILLHLRTSYHRQSRDFSLHLGSCLQHSFGKAFQCYEKIQIVSTLPISLASFSCGVWADIAHETSERCDEYVNTQTHL